MVPAGICHSDFKPKLRGGFRAKPRAAYARAEIALPLTNHVGGSAVWSRYS